MEHLVATQAQRAHHQRKTSAPSPARHIRNKSSASAAQAPTSPLSVKPPLRQESSTAIRPPSASTSSTRKSSEDEKRHFVGNVGSGGTLYLAPSRLQHLVTPATPPDTAGGYDEGILRRSLASTAWTPRYRSLATTDTIPVPAIGLSSLHERRSRSLSHIEPKKDSMEVPNAPEGERLYGGLLDLQIPHYRLGTPRFSTMGTAHLNSAIYTDDEESRTSMLSQQAYDGLFPVPPTMDADKPQQTPHRLHPSSAARRRSRKPSPLQNASNGPAAIFDRIEANPLDATNIRFSENGQLVAASIPRLIAQITSPRFLDYELISDFFLTYRGFLSSLELLDWLIQRMRWALRNDTDAGRIVRVRTFVATRHWVLNYFNDDFVPSTDLRRGFCDHVNQLARELAAQPGRGVGDINIIGELKKCWRRTSALFWPVADAMETSPTEDITAGAPLASLALSSSESLSNPPRSNRHIAVDDSSQALLVHPQLVALDRRTNQRARIVSFHSTRAAALHARDISIPASAMSEDSLQVLSCSVPFLQRVKPDADAAKRAQRSAPRPVGQRRNSLTRHLDAQRRPAAQPRGDLQHRRTESDGVLQARRLTPEHKARVDIDQVPSITLTGGLVRGLLLQPCPPMLQNHAPRSPPLDLSNMGSDEYFVEGYGSVKRIVDDMRRALSHRKTNSDTSVGTHQHSARSVSRSSNHRNEHPRSTPSLDKSSVSSTPRKDVLAARIQQTYDQHFLQPDLRFEAPQTLVPDDLRPPSIGEFGARLGSQITNSSRSIVIVDATSLPAPVQQGGQLDQQSTVMPLFPSIMEAQRPSIDSRMPEDDLSLTQQRTASTSRTQQSSEGHLHESFIFPTPPGVARGTLDTESLYPSQLQIPSTSLNLNSRSPTKQLRRVPGGDLRSAEHVHELETNDDIPSPGESLAITIISDPDAARRSLRPQSSTASHALDDSPLPTRIRPSFQAEAYRLAKVRTNSDFVGGPEAALAMLEGKASAPGRQSGMSWLELPNETETTSHPQTPEPEVGTKLEMADPYAQDGQVYRISQPDHARDASLTMDPPKVIAEHRASSLPVPFNANAVYIVSQSDNDLNARADDASAVFTAKHSFLLDDNQSLSDISTDIAEDNGDDDSAGVRSFFFEDDVAGSARPKAKLARSLAQETQSTISRSTQQERPLRMAINAAKILGVPPGALMADVMHSQARHRNLDDQGHYPFVMAFESRVIAEQLCIIEKDALDEVDWKDLITLNWRHTPSTIRNWADYLKQEESNGIDLVVARFNLVVKWVVSQCVLTESITERARCLTKFIHIAAQCLQLRNYASMAQITLALLSSDLARLQKTWALIHPADKHTLDHLEVLCQPLRNFANLRAEMESSPLAEGCIPFIGLYTHDLMYNAQKSSQLEIKNTSGESTVLINFQRYQTAATIAKSLLRLLDASARYIFRPHPEALSRCLWLAALEDADISDVSMDLE